MPTYLSANAIFGKISVWENRCAVAQKRNKDLPDFVALNFFIQSRSNFFPRAASHDTIPQLAIYKCNAGSYLLTEKKSWTL